MSSEKSGQTSSSGGSKSFHYLHRSIVTVYVGLEKYPFYLHKGRLCQYSSFFEKAFHGSFEEATTGSLYLEEDGVEEFKLFEEWVYTQKLGPHQESDDASLLLVKLFCFAERIGIPKLQNLTINALRDQATGRKLSTKSPTPKPKYYGKANDLFFTSSPASTSSPGRFIAVTEDPSVYYLPPASSSAIHYAYQNTPEGSPLRKLLADIFAYNVKPDTLDEKLQSFPAEFLADVLLVNMRRLPLRFEDEEATFDVDMSEYYLKEPSDPSRDRRGRVFQDTEMHKSNSDTGPQAESSEANIPDDKPYEGAPDMGENSRLLFGGSVGLSSSGGKKKGRRRKE